jgi:hypothetical protein
MANNYVCFDAKLVEYPNLTANARVSCCKYFISIACIVKILSCSVDITVCMTQIGLKNLVSEYSYSIVYLFKLTHAAT